MVDVRTGCPDPPLDPPEYKGTVIDVCQECGENIYRNDGYYDFEGAFVCEFCRDDYLRKCHKTP